jgi:hypothetical protein
VKSKPAVGTAFILYLPRSGKTVPREEIIAEPQKATKKK